MRLTKEFNAILLEIPIPSTAFAEKLLPPLDNEDITPFFAEFKAKYQALIYLTNESVQTNNLEANRCTDNEQSKRDIADLHNQVTNAKGHEATYKINTQVIKAPFSMLRLYGA